MNKARERNQNRKRQDVAQTNENKASNEAEIKNRAYESHLISLNKDNNLLTKLNLIQLYTSTESHLTEFYNYTHNMPGNIVGSTANLVELKSDIWEVCKKKRSYELEQIQVILMLT